MPFSGLQFFKLHPGYISGQWYPPLATPGSGLALTANTVRCAPTLSLSSNVIVTDLAINVTTAAAGGNMQIALYANGSDSLPGQPIVTSGNIDVSTTGIKTVSVTPTALPAGPIWFCANSDSATVATLSVSTASGVTAALLGGVSTSTVLSSALGIGLSATQTFGTWGALTGLSWSIINANRMPWVAFKVQ